MEPYRVVNLEVLGEPIRLEQLGSKPKFWFVLTDDPSRLGLFKLARVGTGEHWAEKIAAELAALLELPHAEYDLAVHDRRSGVVSWSFLDEGESLTIGNEVLARSVVGYPAATEYGRHRVTQEHTVDRVLDECEIVAPPLRWTVPKGLVTGSDVMVGYLLLDAWIGNTDRHDENWGWVRDHRTGRMHLAPTFDHASSLGRNEPDDRRQQRLESRDPGFSLAAYAIKAQSGLHLVGGAKPLSTFDAFQRARTLRPGVAAIWLERLASVTPSARREVIDAVPTSLMSPVAKSFAEQILTFNRDRLLGAGGKRS